jgi:phenylpropionate dioxygenase-like ring-hydroxylating dioxygenase large terminal subunit
MAVIREPGREIGPRTSRLSIERYVDPALLERERAALFGAHPILVAHVSELPAPGDLVTVDLAGVPVIVLRDLDGEVRVLVNACRHRGARLVEDARGCGKKALTCPYHAWSYRLDGSLLHVPDAHAFAGLDHAALGLRVVPHQVRHGFVWACLAPDPGQGADITAFLGPALDDDFEHFALASHQVARTTVRTRAANWKLVMDAFAEGYHLKSLHRQSLARFFLDAAIVDDCAPHVRQVGARKGLLELADRPEADWDLRQHTTVFYNVFPNTVLVFHPLWISQLGLFPEAVDRVRVVHRMLVPAPPADDDERERLDRSFAHIDGQVFEKEDLAIAENIQGTLRSGANREFLLGGLEHGMRLFHQAWDRAMARS